MNVTGVIDGVADALNAAGLYVAKNRNEHVAGFPAAILSVDSIVPTAWGANEMTLTVTVLASKADRVDAWERMYSLLDNNVVLDALNQADPVTGVVNIDNIGADVEYNDGVALGFTVSCTAYGD